MSQLDRLERNYRTAFLRYLSSRDEAALHRGYQIGRAGMTGGLSLLDLVQVLGALLAVVDGELSPSPGPYVARGSRYNDFGRKGAAIIRGDETHGQRRAEKSAGNDWAQAHQGG